MTIQSSVVNKIREDGDGLKVAFTFPFKVHDTSEVKVSKVVKATGVATLQTIVADYTVVLNPTTEGGTVTYVTAPTALEESFIERNVDLKQETDFPNVGSVKEEQIENEFDNSRMIDIQQQEQLDRAPKLKVTTTATTPTFPEPEATKVIGWNSAGTDLENKTLTTTSPGDYPGDFDSGLDASKAASPSVSDIWVATDTKKTYVCFVGGTWVEGGFIVIDAFPEKTSTADDDLFLMEDSAASNAKKKIKFSNMKITENKVKASSDDPTPDFLDSKVDGTTIEENAEVLRVLPKHITRLDLNRVKGIKEPGGTLNTNLFIMEDGTVRACGNVTNNELGIGEGSADNRAIPVQSAVPNDAGAVSKIFVFNYNTFLLMADGDLYAAGTNANGSLGVGDTTLRGIFTKLTGISNVVELSGSPWPLNPYTGVIAIDSSNNMFSWGNNTTGQLGTGDTADKTSPTSVAGSWKKVSLSDSGNGSQHSLAIDSVDDAYATGNNGVGQLGLGDITNRNTFTKITALSNVAQVAAGAGTSTGYSIFRLTNGQIWSTGYNGNGELGVGDTINRTAPVQVSGITNASRIILKAGTPGSCFVITTDATDNLRAWGYNNDGELGIGDVTSRTSPITPTGLSGLTIVDALFYGDASTTSAMILTSTGKVYTCGYNGNGNLMLGDTLTTYLTFQEVTFLPTTVAKISHAGTAGEGMPLILLTDGRVYTGGVGTAGQMGIGEIKSIYVPTPVIFGQ